MRTALAKRDQLMLVMIFAYLVVISMMVAKTIPEKVIMGTIGAFMLIFATKWLFDGVKG
jgi:hypothetical protein